MEFFHLRSFSAKTNFLLLWFNSRCSRTSACWSEQDLGFIIFRDAGDGEGEGQGTGLGSLSTEHIPALPLPHQHLPAQSAPHTATAHRGLNLLPSPVQKLHFWQEIYLLQGQHQCWEVSSLEARFTPMEEPAALWDVWEEDANPGLLLSMFLSAKQFQLVWQLFLKMKLNCPSVPIKDSPEHSLNLHYCLIKKGRNHFLPFKKKIQTSC